MEIGHLTRKLMKITILILTLIGILFLLTYCNQEKMIFLPSKLPADYKYNFDNQFKEYFFKVDDKTKLNGLLFQSDSSKGLIFYLHGNAGSLDSWGNIAGVYLTNHYDFFILDYRGFGKSEGKISGENQFYRDIQIVYDSLKTIYNEKNIVVIGYSIGTGPAAYLASTNNPKTLILKAPYFNLPDLAHHYFKIIPSFLIRYKFSTNKYIKTIKCPVIIFHGNQDEIIYYGSSEKLKELFKPNDRLIPLDGQPHNGINENGIYQDELKKILNH